MKRNLNDLFSFVTVAREGSFTRAAAQLGVTQSALSQAIAGLENRLKLRLLTRTTRSISLTAAGERLLEAIGNRFDEIEAELDMLSALRDKPAGKVRITCDPHVLHALLLPKLTPILRDYPDIEMEFDANHGFRNIVADRFDAGVRLGGTIDKDMIAVPISPPMRMAAAASPDYFAAHPVPETPHDLVAHNCINLRMTSGGGLYVWEFDGQDGPVNVRVEASLFSIRLRISFMPRWTDSASPFCQKVSLTTILKTENWCACLRRGAHRFPVITFIIPAESSHLLPFRWWSKP